MPEIQQGRLRILSLDGEDYVTLTAYEALQSSMKAASDDIRQLTKNHKLLDSEIIEIATLRQDHLHTKDQLDAITIFLRENYAEEIRMGQHNAFGNDLAKAVTYYLGRERELSGRKWWQFWKRGR